MKRKTNEINLTQYFEINQKQNHDDFVIAIFHFKQCDFIFILKDLQHIF